MRLRAESLAEHLSRPLLPVYWVSGDEPFQIDEACKQIRRAAQAQAYTERQVFHAERSFDWQQLRQSTENLSLFAERKLIELRLPSGKPGTEGSAALQDYVKAPPPDTVLLVISGKLEASQQKSKWFSAVEQAGAWLAVWPLEANRLPQWIAQRLRLRQMQASPEAIQLLVDRIEGNLLAADQELEKLCLLYGSGQIDAAQVQAAVSDSARFDIFGLVDDALDGKHGRLARVMFGLRAEGMEPILVLWALHREIRALAQMARECEAGQSVDRVMASYRVWDKRKALVRKALQRGTARDWAAMLTTCSRLDRLVKGQGTGRAWDELLELAFALAGRSALHV